MDWDAADFFTDAMERAKKSFKSWNYNYNNFMCMYYFSPIL